MVKNNNLITCYIILHAHTYIINATIVTIITFATENPSKFRPKRMYHLYYYCRHDNDYDDNLYMQV